MSMWAMLVGHSRVSNRAQSWPLWCCWAHPHC